MSNMVTPEQPVPVLDRDPCDVDVREKDAYQ
jgi:hypothetical protein